MTRIIPLLLLLFSGNLSFSQESLCSKVVIKQTGDGKFRFYNENGRRAIDKRQWDSVSKCIEGYRIAYLNNKSALINNTGLVISSELYDSARHFWNGLAAVKKDGMWGFIDRNGKVVINFLYDHTNDFIENVTEVYYNGKKRSINQKGEILNVADQKLPFISKLKPSTRPSPIQSLKPDQSVQSAFGLQCPPNLDFESGNFQNWQTNIGSTTTSGNSNIITLPVGSWLNNANTATRQMIQDRNANPAATDLYGNFSIHPPSGGQFSVKLGTDQDDVPNCSCPNKRAEAVRYAITVPQPANDYSITFSYAVVFENPNVSSNFHDDHEQPRFRSKLYRQNGQTIDCATFTFVASGPLPGFDTSALTKNPNAIIKYKDWSSVYVNLSEYPGETLYLEFATADCTLGGHFGYAYVDVSECGITGVSNYNCGSPNVATLTAPPGFESYTWFDNNFTNQLGTDQSLFLSNPILGTDYKVIVTPYANTGCPTCDCSDTLTLKVQATYPLADAGADKNICLASSTNIGSTASAGVTYSWSPSIALSNPSVANPIANPAANTQYILTAINTATGCTAKDTVNVFVNPIPSASFSVNDTEQCLKGNIFSFTNTSTVSSGTLSYLWDFGDGTTSAGISPTHSYLASGNYSVTLTATSITGCTQIQTTQVSVIASPLSSFQINNGSQCLNGNQFVFNSSGATGLSYTWNVNGQNFGSQPNFQHVFATSGAHSVKLVVTNPLGCIDSSSQIVNVYPQPQPDFSVNDATQCLDGNSFSLMNGSSITQGFLSYNWNFGDGTGTSSQQSPTYNFSSPGTYSIRLILTSNFGCVDSIKKNVTIYPDPAINYLINSGSQCFENNQFVFTNSSAISQGALIYTWTFGDGGVSNQSSPTYSYSSPGVYTVRLVGSSVNGCSDTAIQTINVYPEPVVGFSINDAAQCQNANLFSFLNNTSIPSGSLIYRWTFGDGSPIASVAQPNHVYSSAGTYTIKLVVNSNYGCIDSAIQTVVVFPEPVMTVNVNDAAQCLPGNNFVFLNSSTVSSGTNTYAWYFGDGFGSNQINPIHSYSNPGTYVAQLLATTNNGCVDSASVPIDVFAIPDVNVTPANVSLCQGESHTLVSTASPGSGTIQFYTWYRNGIQVTGAGSSLLVNTSGSYSVKVINSNGCEKESAASVVVVNPLPAGDILPPSSTNICEGSSVHLYATPGYIYQWFFNGAPIISAISDNILATQAGDYSVHITNQFGCSIIAANKVVLKFVAKPVADFLFDQSCLNVPIAFANTSDIAATGPVTWLWTFGDGAGSAVFNPIHTYNNVGVYNIKLVARSVVCTQLADSSEKEIKIVAAPVGIRYPTVNAVLNQPHQLQARQIGTDYLWKPAMGVNNAGIDNPLFQHNDDQEYQVRIRLSSGCIVTDTVLVMVHGDGDIFVPRAWSPNLDGHNDYLYPILVGMMELKMFRIFNRWGQLMFETRTPRHGWNGIFHNAPQPNDTYTWTVEAVGPDGKVVRKSGNAILMR